MKTLNKFVFALLILFLGLLSACSSKSKFEDDYQMFKGEEHVFYKASYKEVYKSLTKKKGSFVILFAYDPDLYVCPYCMEVLPILNEVARESKIDKILYLDIRAMRVDRTREYLDLIEYIEKQVSDLEIRNDKTEIIVPDVYVVQDGKILGHHIATLKDEEGTFILNLNEEQKDELKSIYKNLFEKIKS